TRAVRPYLPSTSFQNSAADLPLIVSRLLNERRNSASRSRRKSHLMSLSGIPSSGDVSDTPVPTHHKTCRGIPLSGDRSVTPRQEATLNASRAIPRKGDRSDTSVWSQLRCVSFIPRKGDRSATRV